MQFPSVDMSNGASFSMKKTYAVTREQGLLLWMSKVKGGISVGALWTCCACSSSPAGLLGAYFDEFHSVSAHTFILRASLL